MRDDAELADLLSHALQKDPARRLPLDRFVAHRWLQDGGGGGGGGSGGA
jgi:hypothetical protein